MCGSLVLLWPKDKRNKVLRGWYDDSMIIDASQLSSVHLAVTWQTPNWLQDCNFLRPVTIIVLMVQCILRPDPHARGGKDSGRITNSVQYELGKQEEIAFHACNIHGPHTQPQMVNDEPFFWVWNLKQKAISWKIELELATPFVQNP